MTANHSRGRRRRTWQRWDAARKKELTELWLDRTNSVEMIADQLETSTGAIYLQAGKLGLPPRSEQGRKRRLFKRKKAAGDGQRRFAGFVNHGGPRVKLAPWHPSLRKGTTIFPSTVIPAGHVERVLKSGEHSRKIGRIMDKGRWKGMPFYTLTLEERETCPRSCLQWQHCYGNNMHQAQRLHDDGTLTLRLTSELLYLSVAHPQGFIVRLHVLGDFYSVAYVEFWRTALEKFRNLRIFGFTARLPREGDIGMAVAQLAADFPDRVAMRFSGGGYDTDCAEVVDKPEDATGIRCPAETDPDRCCATCGLCMQTNRTISFVRH